MANKLALISTVTLGSDNTQIELTNIPQTYQTIIIRGQIRLTQASTVDSTMRILVNNNAASTYTTGELIHRSSLSLNYNALSTSGRNEYIVGSTANTGANTIFEYRIEDYTGSQDKRVDGWSSSMATSTVGVWTHQTTRTSFSSAVSQIRFFVTTGNIVANSKLWLFGIPAS